MSPRVVHVPSGGQADGRAVYPNAHGSGTPAIPSQLGAIYTDDATGNLYTGTVGGWVLSSAGGGGAVYNGNGAPTLTPSSSAALYYDKMTKVVYEWDGSGWV